MQSLPTEATCLQRVAASFERQAVMRTMGIRLGKVAAGQVDLHMAHHPDLTQQHGFLHAGVLSTALDSACGYAAFSLMPPQAAVLTIEFKINLLAPARGPSFRFEGRVTKRGRTISVVDGQAFQITDGSPETLIASMSATVMTVLGRDAIQQ